MLFLITLENLENRYSTQWRRWISNDLNNAGIEYIEIDGNPTSNIVKGENFLNPNLSSIWKSEQIIKIAKLFESNQIKKDDKFLFYDAWDWNVISLRYMSILNNIPIKIFGMWHAGSYDPQDLLGQMDKKKYLLSFEQSLFHNLDKSFVATEFHKNMIKNNLKIEGENIKITGFPYNFDELDKYKIPYLEKENIVIFPHRLSKEKKPELLKEIANHIDGKVIFCQENKLSKKEYHKLLAKSKIVFSANEQETWGIGVFEALYLGCIPVIPNRLSYREAYNDLFKYDKIYENVYDLTIIINNKIKNYKNYIDYMENNIKFLKKHFCTFKKILNEIGGDNYVKNDLYSCI